MIPDVSQIQINLGLLQGEDLEDQDKNQTLDNLMSLNWLEPSGTPQVHIRLPTEDWVSGEEEHLLIVC